MLHVIRPAVFNVLANSAGKAYLGDSPIRSPERMPGIVVALAGSLVS